MDNDCNAIPLNNSYSCSNPWGEECTIKGKFQFVSLWNYTKNIQAACPNDTRLFLGNAQFATADNASLTQEACVSKVGSGWTPYPVPDIWTRLTTWKFPLMQLVASFPRPPLSLTVEFFVILHLLGDPINTMESLLLKMSKCQITASYWKEECQSRLEGLYIGDQNRQKRDFNWKALALITDAYGEWAEDDTARDVLHDAL